MVVHVFSVFYTNTHAHATMSRCFQTELKLAVLCGFGKLRMERKILTQLKSVVVQRFRILLVYRKSINLNWAEPFETYAK